jgi:hypothetical protein
MMSSIGAPPLLRRPRTGLMHRNKQRFQSMISPASASSLVDRCNSRRGRVSFPLKWSCPYFNFFPPSVMVSRNSVIVRFMNSTSAALAGEAAKWPCNDGITT